jgi:hypothetical protein
MPLRLRLPPGDFCRLKPMKLIEHLASQFKG